jgi:hypothetical protein
MVRPNAVLPDSLVALYVMPTSGDTLTDTALVVRPSLGLDLSPSIGTSLAVELQGGFPDARGQRLVVVSVVTSQSVVLDSLSLGRVDVLAQLSRVSAAQALVRASFVDPVYGDTARDSAWIPVPARSIRFVPSSVQGPRGALAIELVDPWTYLDVRTVLVAHGRDTILVRLARGPTGAFTGLVPFTQAAIALGDTLVLGRPAAGTDSVFAIPAPPGFPRRSRRPGLGVPSTSDPSPSSRRRQAARSAHRTPGRKSGRTRRSLDHAPRARRDPPGRP